MAEELNADQQRRLLELARCAIGLALGKGGKSADKLEDPALKEKRGAFVTLKVEGRLRGCIGFPLPAKSLAETVAEAAVAAATQDFRFPSLSLEELPRTRIEISVLTRPHKIKDLSAIEVGRHGIIVSKGPHKGLLLPQVPAEYGWDREAFLRHGCLKAGLDENEWRKGVEVEIFAAQVFSEHAA